MSRTKHHKGQRDRHLGRDLWRPGPISGQSRTSDNIKRERRIMRRTAKVDLHLVEAREARKVCPVTGSYYGHFVSELDE